MVSDTLSGRQRQYFLTIKGIKRILATTRKPIALKICEIIGIELLGIKVVCKETNFITQIKRAFMGERMMEQFPVGKHRIDLYFPDRRTGIEFDEIYHSQQKARDTLRKNTIESSLGCIIIQVGEKDDIFDTINKIIRSEQLGSVKQKRVFFGEGRR